MALNEDLALLIGELHKLERPPLQSDVDNLVAHVGSSPSIATLEALLKFFKARRDTIERVDIPCVMAEYGVKRVMMEDGTDVSLAQFYEPKQGDKELLALWVSENGYADIIKDNFAFGKGEADAELLQFLEEHQYSYSRDSSINSQTLKKVIKDHVAAGGALPPREAVQVSIFESAVVKAPKGEGF